VINISMKILRPRVAKIKRSEFGNTRIRFVAAMPPGLDKIIDAAPKKSCMDRAKNGIARTAAQIRTGHWRSAVYLKRIKKRRREDKCWFCCGQSRMTRSHVLLHCRSDKIKGEVASQVP
jgi:hypothetical protein